MNPQMNDLSKIWWETYMAALSGASADPGTISPAGAVTWATECADMTIQSLTNKKTGWFFDPTND